MGQVMVRSYCELILLSMVECYFHGASFVGLTVPYILPGVL